MSSHQPGHDICSKERTVDVLTKEKVSFEDLLLSSPILSGLQKARFEQPSPIQLKAIPYGRCGLDLIVQAKSGTGKTCVFTVVALEAVSVETPTLQVIILAPTREIAIQIEDVIKAVGQDIKSLKIAAFIGGRPLSEDKVNAKGCHIAVGSPGRIFQLIELEVLKCQTVRMFILDEADKLLEENFQSQINSIYSMLPSNKQMIAASATYPDELAQFVTRYMRDPTFVRLNPKDMALLGVKQYCYVIENPPDKFHSAFECKIKAVLELLESYRFQQVLIFSNYHSHAKDLSDACNSIGLPATYISGNLEQERRLEAMKMLKDFKCRVLISTDLTSRGIDASNIDLVVNLDVPHDWETYMHRTGRAGRFGSLGAVISVVHSGKEKKDLLEKVQACSVSLYPLHCNNGKLKFGTEKVKFDLTDRELMCALQNTPAEISAKLSMDRHPEKIVEKKVNVEAERSTTHEKKGVPVNVPNEVILSELPRIPTLPELSRSCNTDSTRFSYSYQDLMENFFHYKEHGVFRELKTISIRSENKSDVSISVNEVPINANARHLNISDDYVQKGNSKPCTDQQLHAFKALYHSGEPTYQNGDRIVTGTMHQILRKPPKADGARLSKSYAKDENKVQIRSKAAHKKQQRKSKNNSFIFRDDGQGKHPTADKRKNHRLKELSQGHTMHENAKNRVDKHKDQSEKGKCNPRKGSADVSVKLLLPKYSAESQKNSRQKCFAYADMARRYEMAWCNYYSQQYWSWWQRSLGGHYW